MAHGDYDCCAVCDSKLGYSNDACTKEEVCAYCAVALVQVGILARNGDEFAQWIKANDIATIYEKLVNRPVKRCYYGNAVDDALNEKGYFDANNQ